MTCTKRRPDGEHRGGGRDRGRSAAEGSTPRRLDELELLAEVDRLVTPVLAAVHRRHGPIAGVGTPAWWAAPDDAKVAGLLVLAEAWVIHDPERAVRQRLRELSYDLSASTSWTERARRRVTHAQLEHRRAGAA